MSVAEQHEVLQACQSLANPFQYHVVSGPFDRRPMPICEQLMRPVEDRVLTAVAEHRTRPDQRPNRILSYPIIMITGETGSGKSRLLAHLTERFHGNDKRRLVVNVSPHELLSDDDQPTPLLCRRVEAFLFDDDVPGFPGGSRPIDLLAQRILKLTINRIREGNTRLNVPADVENVVYNPHPVRLLHTDRRRQNLVNHVRRIQQHLDWQEDADFRARVLLGAVGDLNGEPVLVGTSTEARRQLMRLIGLSNYLQCPITFVFDQFESLQIGYRELGPVTLRAFMQKLVDELTPMVASRLAWHVPLVLCALVGGEELSSQLFDRNTRNRIPVLPNGKQEINIQDYGFQIADAYHCQDVTKAYLDHFWEHQYQAWAQAIHQRTGNPLPHFGSFGPLWPFGTDGFEAIHAARDAAPSTIRDWLLLCSSAWRKLVTEWRSSSSFEAHRQTWLARLADARPDDTPEVRTEIPEAAPAVAPNGVPSPPETEPPLGEDEIQEFIAPPPDETQVVPATGALPVRPPQVIVAEETTIKQAAAEEQEAPEPPADVNQFLSHRLMDLKWRLQTDTALAENMGAKTRLAAFLENLTKAQHSPYPPTIKPNWMFFAVFGKWVMITVSDAQNRPKHERLWKENLQTPYDGFPPQLKDQIKQFLYLSVGGNRFDTLPDFYNDIPVICYQVTADDWYRIVALAELMDPTVGPKPANMDADAIRMGVNDALLRHWSLFLQLRHPVGGMPT